MATIPPDPVLVAAITTAVIGALHRLRNGMPPSGMDEVALTGETLPLMAFAPDTALAREIAQKADWRDPREQTLPTANDAERLLEDNADRKRYLVQNLGPGIVRVKRSDGATGGIRLDVGDVWIDEMPWVFTGEVWAWADVANTVVIVSEWV